jgi:predicted ATPase/class 3 adenylate cyclase
MIKQLPVGTVTFLFTDIEGSTKLWQEHPDAMTVALSRHHAILSESIAIHGGYVFQIIGDEFCGAFSIAKDGLEAALDAQRRLKAEEWGEIGAIRVRMVLHTGSVELRAGEYVSGEYISNLTLSRTARLLSVGHGGQVLLSQSTKDLLTYDIPDGIKLRDLGEHRLKDLLQVEHIYQVLSDGLPDRFPSLKSVDALPNNLPIQLTSFVGRVQEVEEICAYLRREVVRLITLTGPGGVGKSRLSLQVGVELLHDFKDGVFFIALAPIQKPGLVASVIAQTLGVRESTDRSFIDVLKDELGEKQILLILDNFEQVVSAAPLVSELLSSIPLLKVLVTSRIALHLRGENIYTVQPLSLPPKDLMLKEGSESTATLFSNEAVRLFFERAVAVKADLIFSEENIRLIANICHQLEGLPLGIELAAARIRHLPPRALLKRLSSRLQILKGGGRDLPERQQTLRATLDWSYDLLGDNERCLFSCLGVFPGGCTLDAAEAISDLPDSFDVLSGIASLVENSLLIQKEDFKGEPRYWMLETIREYALEHLEASGEAAIVWRKHLQFLAGLAKIGDNKINGPDADYWYKIFQTELDNVRATLNWVLESKFAEEQDIEVAAWLAGRLWWAWYQCGDLADGRRWATQILDRLPMNLPARAKLLIAVGCYSWQQGDYSTAAPFLDDSVKLWRELHDEFGLAEALHFQGHLIFDQKEYVEAGILYQESRELYRRLGDFERILPLIGDLGMVAYHLGDYEKARNLYEECLVLSREHGSKDNIAQTLYRLGDLARLAGDNAGSDVFYKEGLTYFKEMGTKLEIASGLHKLGYITLYRHDPHQAGILFKESIKIQQEAGNKQGIAECLFGLAGVAGIMGQLEHATQLFGAGQALLDMVGAPLSPADKAEYERDLAEMQRKLAPNVFENAWKVGQAMTIEQAIELALQQGKGPDRQLQPKRFVL